MSDFLKNHKTVLTILMLIALTPLVFYVWEWGFSLSKNHTTWGEFGSFLSGIYAPILSILSLLVILYQTNIIKRQVEIAAEQRNISAAQTELIGTQAQIAEEQSNIQKQQLKLQTDFQSSDNERNLIETKRYYLGIYIKALDECLKRNIETSGYTSRNFKILPKDGHFKISDNSEKLKQSILNNELTPSHEDLRFIFLKAPQLFTNWMCINAIIHELRSSDNDRFREEGNASFMRVGNVLGIENCTALDVIYNVMQEHTQQSFSIHDYFFYRKYQKNTYKD